MRKLLTLLICLLFLCGCERITEGEIYDKEFESAHSETVIINQVRRIGKSTTVIPTPHFRSYPDQWFVSIKQTQEDGSVKTATYEVSKEIYDSVQVGDYFTITE